VALRPGPIGVLDRGETVEAGEYLSMPVAKCLAGRPRRGPNGPVTGLNVHSYYCNCMGVSENFHSRQFVNSLERLRGLSTQVGRGWLYASYLPKGVRVYAPIKSRENTRSKKVATRKKESMQPEIVLFVGIVVGIVVGLATLVVALSALRNGQRVSEKLEEKIFKLQHDLQRAHWAELDAKKEVRKLQEQLVEQRPDKLFGKLEHATGELEQLQLKLSESERLVGQQKQELSQQSERQEGERQRLEQEHQHLMEEVERWHGRYVECQQKVEHLEQEYSEAQQKVEQLTQLRERLRAEMDDIGTTSTDTVRVSENLRSETV
jgi:DNA repair exonuclease SbcCD ATPase subunit